MKNNRIWIAVLLTVITVFGLTDCSIFDSKTEAKIEQAIEEGDFTKAKQLTKKLSRYEKFDMEYKVCRAQVSSLIVKGEYELAVDIAREDADYGVYFNALLNKLTYIYNNNNQDLMMVVSSISFPRECESLYWNSKYEYFQVYDLNELYSQYNSALHQVMTFAKNNEDVDVVRKLAGYLKPQYKQVKKKVKDWNVKLQEYVWVDGMVWEDTPSDYTQVNQIKKEFGIK